MPPPLDRRATPYPVPHGISLQDFERLIAGEADEVAAAFDQGGRLAVAPRRGTPASVDFYAAEVGLLRDTIVTHVHPLGGAFSGADAKFAFDNDVAEMRAVLPTGVVLCLERPPLGWPKGEILLLAAERCLEVVEEEAAQRRRRGAPGITEREYHRITLRDQQDAFAQLGVRMKKERWR